MDDFDKDWAQVKRGGQLVALCKRCTFECFVGADATIEEHDKKHKAVTLGGGAFSITPVTPDDPRLRTKVTDEDIDAWMRKLCAVAKIGTVDFRRADRPDAPMGLIGVPGKYVAVIDAMHAAMTALAHGEPLPEFAPVEGSKPKKARRK